LNLVGQTHGLELLDAGEYAIGRPEADDDLGHTEKKGLDPKPHGLPVKLELVVLAADLGTCLEFYPFDGISWGRGLCVPDCLRVSTLGILGEGKLRPLTGIDFAAETDNRVAEAGADDRAVLFLVVDNLLVSILDVVS
jgi:hypothetical protein